MSSFSLNVTLAQAIAFLTRPLLRTTPAATVVRLQSLLEANLTALFAPTWEVTDPLRGSGRRCLTLSPNCLPHRYVYAACVAAGVQWFDWMAALGGREFDFFVDPGSVSVRFGQGAKLITVWSEELMVHSLPNTSSSATSKTLAQQLLENDEEEDEQIFAMIADEVSAPTWMAPILDKFPMPIRSESPLSAISSDSRSSNSSSCFSSSDSRSSTPSNATASSAGSVGTSNLSRRERARQARVFIDTTKTQVTPYDGGKTTVLTGGVMLGAARAPAKSTPQAGSTATTWRRV
ncbi:hypothetical protein CONPUDRAFT_140992 [Coniophora puteana RWD-64-598 SS2]|uniref:Anti-proliferative protein domain-containing protein n=1 Tax=Coniophora puteana (strain RWD-64-598) TaxID=741705 RepID=A0A5M3N4S7_CONPW|nr:uncharacterized protein CONPUDRAFT_140992 [Coniophora puteana RWD-64-598 SS2]EIW86430.1 hypothetical protein CONPUDRAFT_140992 [Coniophora puteana RWD-64-598 SS2]